ncbi:MAG: hypothetical protein HPY90_13580 [Syntrophothermus sp.]|uniref:hypothetical protein n=1 Tax=Syntrophothermus sp. TaxID=2736299 RepID=UPI0025807BD9|nr:hypothetical protein [Syntrophothermus sp.]NSW84276.1 hypothetical protein [Syntrophothermus sp.]
MAASLIQKLETLGYRFEVDGETIRYRRVLKVGDEDPRPLLLALKTRKAEALAYLRQRQEPHPRDRVCPDCLHSGSEKKISPDIKAPKDPAQEAAKGRVLLRRQGYVLIYSHLLGETIALVQPGFQGRLPEGMVSYTTEEIKLLKDLSEDDLKLLHKAKRELGATVVPYLERSKEMDRLAEEALKRLAAVHPEGALPWAEKHRPDLLEMCSRWEKRLNEAYEELDLEGFKTALLRWEQGMKLLFKAYEERG